jgi:restriction system protein
MALGVHLAALRDADYWLSLSWSEFENEVASLFRRVGFAVTVTAGKGDQGVDVVATKGTTKCLIQCKKHASPIGPHAVRELLGVLVQQRGNRGVLISTAGFTNGAYNAAQRTAIVLIDLDDLISIHKTECIDEYIPS